MTFLTQHPYWHTIEPIVTFLGIWVIAFIWIRCKTLWSKAPEVHNTGDEIIYTDEYYFD